MAFTIVVDEVSVDRPGSIVGTSPEPKFRRTTFGPAGAAAVTSTTIGVPSTITVWMTVSGVAVPQAARIMLAATNRPIRANPLERMLPPPYECTA